MASATLLLDLESDTLALNNNDPVATWPDLSGSGNNFVQPDSLVRPIFKATGANGKPCVLFDHAGFFNATNAIDGLTDMTVFFVGSNLANVNSTSGVGDVIAHTIDSISGTGGGWFIANGGNYGAIFTDQFAVYLAARYTGVLATDSWISTFKVRSADQPTIAYNGDYTWLPDSAGSGPINYAQAGAVTRLGAADTPLDTLSYYGASMLAILIYSGSMSAEDEGLVMNWLAARYGVTL